jgi:hypothetical protein
MTDTRTSRADVAAGLVADHLPTERRDRRVGNADLYASSP